MILVWSNWANEGECPVTCGWGKMIQKRSCLGGNVGDVGCEGNETREVTCNTQNCPGKINLFVCLTMGLHYVGT